MNPKKNNELDLTRIEQMKEELAAQAATLALERERLKELDRRLTEWACELAARAASLNEREEARTSRIYDFRVCFDDPATESDVANGDAADQSVAGRAEVTAEP